MSFAPQISENVFASELPNTLSAFLFNMTLLVTTGELGDMVDISDLPANHADDNGTYGRATVISNGGYEAGSITVGRGAEEGEVGVFVEVTVNDGEGPGPQDKGPFEGLESQVEGRVGIRF